MSNNRYTKRKQFGRSLLKSIIVSSIVFIFIIAYFIAVKAKTQTSSEMPLNAEDTRCVSSYQSYKNRQIIDKDGKDIPCS